MKVIGNINIILNVDIVPAQADDLVEDEDDPWPGNEGPKLGGLGYPRTRKIGTGCSIKKYIVFP